MTRTPRPPRARDAAGRPVPTGSPAAVDAPPEEALAPSEALVLARQLLAAQRPFFAHDVLEAVWKARPGPERELWQGLAQVCVGLTHAQRGNPVGAARLLRRGAGLLQAYAGPSHEVDLMSVVQQAEQAAGAIEAGTDVPTVRI